MGAVVAPVAFVAQRRARTRKALERAVARGELTPGVDLELVQDLLTGPVFYRALMSGEPSSDELIANVVDIVVAGVVHMSAQESQQSQQAQQ